MYRLRWWPFTSKPGIRQEGGAHALLNGERWRRALLLVIAQLLLFKLVVLIGMKLAFFSGGGEPVSPDTVAKKLFPGPANATVMEKPHG